MFDRIRDLAAAEYSDCSSHIPHPEWGTGQKFDCFNCLPPSYSRGGLYLKGNGLLLSVYDGLLIYYSGLLMGYYKGVMSLEVKRRIQNKSPFSHSVWYDWTLHELTLNVSKVVHCRRFHFIFAPTLGMQLKCGHIPNLALWKLTKENQIGKKQK